MITGIDFVSLPVADMARAKAFYQDTLGLKPLHQMDNWAEFDLGDGPALALMNNAAYGMPTEPVEAGSVAIAFDDFDGMVGAMREQGRLKQDPFDSPVCHGAFIKDTEGNSLALHHRKGEPGRDRVMDFVAVPVEDMARARAFYEGTLGLVPDNLQSEVWTEYVLADDSALALGDVRVMGLAFAPVIGGTLGLRTPDLEAGFEKLKAMGLATMEAIYETPVCHMGFVKDTEGNALVLHRHK
jgi:catechol 2,3-dioxygenase-like lactoylglutathione lyase family enzyme